jgi:two-component system chemotaxis response regulator CheB
VDFLFQSIARLGAGSSVIAVLLTGMGSDGAKGLLELRRKGARTIVQDQKSSVIYGMPAEAARLGAAQSILPLKDIAGAIIGALRSPAMR